MTQKHDFDAAWKSILEAFEIEIVELLFPELYEKIDWEKGTEALDKELLEIQKDIFDKNNSQLIISDKIIKVRLKNNESKILFIHVEVQSYSSGSDVFGERMFRYFYRIWDKFRYKYEDKSEIIAAAIYTYKGDRGKDKQYLYKCLDLDDEVLVYNFRTIDVEKVKLENISEDNPLKLVFKMAKELIELNPRDENIYNSKIKLMEELVHYDKVKNNEQIKALADFLEYLFLIQDEELKVKYREYKENIGGVSNLSIDEIRKIYYEQKGIEKRDIEIVLNMLSEGLNEETISKLTKIDINKVLEIKDEYKS
ncbi:Rpn family recombination-promoting nuclease/putative transposase [Romboutsia sp.]|uniref:Rpn family recombination-promoting nuclease/putative transposase n=1 Tax=Romboutsia sp. TaxID=1965302 RepID=UPI003F2E5999